MPTHEITPIQYHPDGAYWFERFAHLPYPAWLDSCQPHSAIGRYGIISAAPQQRLITNGSITTIEQLNYRDDSGLLSSSSSAHTSNEDPLDLINTWLQQQPKDLPEDIPFAGGVLGYWGYDLGRRYERLPEKSLADTQLADMQVGCYDWSLVQDHHQRRAWVIILASCQPAVKRSIKQQIDSTANLEATSSKPDKSFKISNFEEESNFDSYTKSIRNIQNYIAAGDCYQVNFAQRFKATYSGDTLEAYQKLRTILPSPFCAYLKLNDEQSILSLSPERFIKCHQGQVETKPIKGTIPRGKTLQDDQRNADTLLNSQKDRAENVMIVDLLRNDLSKVCTPYSVKTPKLFELESYANVHHLVSTVSGQLQEDKSCADLLRATFPGGSITGAPKIRAMEIIDELETFRRSAYCGSIGYLSINGNMDTNIAIRTLMADKGNLYCWGGGGITADSDPKAEYDESLAKVSLLMQTLSSL